MPHIPHRRRLRQRQQGMENQPQSPGHWQRSRYHFPQALSRSTRMGALRSAQQLRSLRGSCRARRLCFHPCSMTTPGKESLRSPRSSCQAWHRPGSQRARSPEKTQTRIGGEEGASHCAVLGAGVYEHIGLGSEGAFCSTAGRLTI
jgi:hypothetical protein